MDIGKYNKLTVARLVDFGAYLADEHGAEVLLPAKYITEPLEPGGEIEVFVYRDSDDRPVAVTDHPFVTVGQFAFLECVASNRIGAFLDWGLPKDLLVPFSEQKVKMRPGMQYFVYVYLDNATGRIVATAKIEKYLGNVLPQYRVGQPVEALVYLHTDIGYACVVDNLHRGMIYESELHRTLEIGETTRASVKRVRPDGKIDLTPEGNAAQRTQDVAGKIEEVLKIDGTLGVTEKSSPADIDAKFKCSKKDFKKAIGKLLKERKVEITESGEIVLAQK